MQMHSFALLLSSSRRREGGRLHSPLLLQPLPHTTTTTPPLLQSIHHTSPSDLFLHLPSCANTSSLLTDRLTARLGCHLEFISFVHLS